MSYLGGQQPAAQAGSATFDEQMLRKIVDENYLLSSSFGNVDRDMDMDFINYQAHGIRVKEEPKGVHTAVDHGGSINPNVPYHASSAAFPNTGYTTPAESSIASEGNHVSSRSGTAAVFANSDGSSVNNGNPNFGGSDGYMQGERNLELQQQQQLQLQQELQQQLSEEQQDLNSQGFDSSQGIKDTEEQIRRKRALNRAAQKAFRERKEARVKQLEKQLKQSENDREQLLNELEDLRKHNIEMHAENRILLQTKNDAATTAINAGSIAGPLGTASQNAYVEKNKFTFPSKRDFVDELVDHQQHSTQRNVTPPSLEYSHNGEQVMTVSATWEYLHKMSENLQFDLSLVIGRLKDRVVCHGKGPSYFKSDIDEYIEASRST
ncbi:unnamed protein product [Kluyveromyces dobzhanskii CBS 2104]|uniref:WGS project CCBQ000000000 data, contig 00015 n=1 Tax=Kluyveromyces dobzhanskii CBS 2104 TaxID=1427455 RepID=A0A0A8LAL8_9SACH|nr:unnamed protein product [Kluyveromyces dobzhanskii CBS 2104]